VLILFSDLSLFVLCHFIFPSALSFSHIAAIN